MMDISCSENCMHSKNGKCTFNHVTPLSSVFSLEAGCAYFIPKQPTKKTPLK